MSTWIVENFETLKRRYSKHEPLAKEAMDTEDYFQEAVEFFLNNPHEEAKDGNHDKTFYFKIRNRKFVNRRSNVRKLNNMFNLCESHINLKDYLKWKALECEWYENRD